MEGPRRLWRHTVRGYLVLLRLRSFARPQGVYGVRPLVLVLFFMSFSSFQSSVGFSKVTPINVVSDILLPFNLYFDFFRVERERIYVTFAK